MKASLCHLFIPCALFAAGAFASSHSDIEVLRRAEDDLELNEWLAASNRVPPEALKKCPVSCNEAGNGSSEEWFLFSDETKLASCNETMLLSMVVQTEADDNAQTVIKACTANYGSGVKAAFVHDETKASLCTTSNQVLEEAAVYMQQPQAGGNDVQFSADHLLSAGRQITNHLALQMPSCTNNAIEFAYFQSSVIGIFAGAEVHQHGVGSDVLKNLLKYVEDNAVSKTTVVQLCGVDGRGADYSIGIVASSAKNLPFVKNAVKTWADGGCVSQADMGEAWMPVTLRVPVTVEMKSKNGTSIAPASFGTTPAHHAARSRLSGRADCRTTKVAAGDGCWAVADRCGISQTDLEKYNRANLCTTLIRDEIVCCGSGTLPSTLPPGNADGTCKMRSVIRFDDCTSLATKCGISGTDFMKVNTKTNLCSTLQEGQLVCCTSGKRPDLKPKPSADGVCATYTTQPDDNCSKLAAARDLTLTDLENFNKNTWGWVGCGTLYRDFKMCTSAGSPPMPAPVANAVCGPMMVGTVQPPAGTNISTLNPCPLNVCCNIWGQCGMNDDFCVASKSESGAPGTSGGKNGCISNCGRDIIKGTAPAKKIKIAYFEAWNYNRKCLTMDVDQIDTSIYTHIHFAFANLTPDFKVDISDENIKNQFEIFKAMTGVKKIISFGGWDFSTLPGTFQILRSAVSAANRETFKNNLIAFMNEHSLDGIDLDWEYPGAPDIPDIPSDDPENGQNYYIFLARLKAAVGASKSVSFAAPASYWYLRSYPINLMAKHLDYIVYMTYDLHGQWDYDNKWSSPGCLSGNCLRSHVNLTETKDALSMITKAGAPSNKVVVGVTSYGRSFKMATAGCDSENCLFTGSPRLSNAAVGRCTDTAGYISNAEIDEIILKGNVKQWKKEGSDFLVYNNTEWVAYMADDTKKVRAAFYDSFNFAGTTDWAVDLQTFQDGSGDDGYDDDYEPPVNLEFWPQCVGEYSTLQQLEDRNIPQPDPCMEQYIVSVQVTVLEQALAKYQKLISDGYDDKFKIYERYAKAQVPDQVVSFMVSDKVDKYFTCKDTGLFSCCNSCQGAWCGTDCLPGTDCKDGLHTFDIKCPRIAPNWGLTGPENRVPNATFTLTDPKGFWKDIEEEWGIEESWITFGKQRMRLHKTCQYAPDVEECMEKNDVNFHNYPIANKVKIYNPKEIISGSLSNVTELLTRLKIVAQFGDWDELMHLSDLVDATSLPAYSTAEAITSMEKVIEKAEEIKKAEREEFILSFVSGLLFFIPFVGEAAGAAGLTAARTMLRLIGTTGEAGLGIYDLVTHPENAFMSVFTFLAGAGVGRAGFRNAANSRRGVTPDVYNSLGGVKTNLDKVHAIRASICPI
ncbi:hypothetical protein V492_06644 [Pseudogymnoascus sp. VKM F-4246]|nr:hypothetical protein V492_06644 [Pseudogymnoascus sp. VKM F-4246]